jgi:uncharacterized protein YqjF (DUF2071 family)
MPTCHEIDRLAPTRPPADWPVMRQRWAKLLFLHWPVPSAMLRPLVPAELEIDTFDDQAYVGLVPFTMTGIRPVGLPPVWGISSFHEVNVRTYVHFQGRDPGVWFFSLDAASRLGVRIARALWRLPYHFARMDLVRQDGLLAYRSDRRWPGPCPASCALRYRPQGGPTSAQAGTLEHFLIERYILYAHTGKRLLTGRVHHAPYPVQTADVCELTETLVAAAGISVAGAPSLVHYVEEMRVRIFAPRHVHVL